jgi:16S rRNA (cytosine1402-N4)-methyltransferase
VSGATLDSHVPVLVREVLTALRPRSGGRYLDCTVGAGGHAAAILEASAPGGRLLGLDADASAIEVAHARLDGFGDRVALVRENYRHLAAVLAATAFGPLDGVLFDLSSTAPSGDFRSARMGHWICDSTRTAAPPPPTS